MPRKNQCFRRSPCYLFGFLPTKYTVALVLGENRGTAPSHEVRTTHLCCDGISRVGHYPGLEEAYTARFEERWYPERNVRRFMVLMYSYSVTVSCVPCNSFR